MKTLLYSGLILALAATMVSCQSSRFAKAYSSTSGWDYSSPASGGYEMASGSDQLADVVVSGNTRGDLFEMKKEKRDEKNASGERMINYNASVHLNVKNTDTAITRISTLAKKHGGYVSGSGSSYVNMRVRSEDLQAVLAEIAQFGKVTSKSVTGQDVTDQYTDLKMRLENAEKSRQRYLDLLSKAASVTEILPIERELERLSLDIERIKGTITRLENENAFSFVSVYVVKPKKPGVVGYVFVGIYKGVKWLFVRG